MHLGDARCNGETQIIAAEDASAFTSTASRPALNQLPLEQIAILGFRFASSHALDSIPREGVTDRVGRKIFYGEFRAIDSKGHAVPSRKSNRRSRPHKSDQQNRLVACKTISVLPFLY